VRPRTFTTDCYARTLYAPNTRLGSFSLGNCAGLPLPI